MAQLQWKVEGRRFRNVEDYQAALRDKALIDSITADMDLDNPHDIEKLYMTLKNGKYEFESIVGRKFDDNIYELYQQIKKEEEEKAEQQRLQKEKRKQEVEKIKDELKAPIRAISGKKKKTGPTERIRLSDFDRDMQKRILHEMKKKERQRRLILTACLMVCLMSFGYLGAYYKAAAKSAQQFEELAAIKEADKLNSSGGEVVVHLIGEKEAPNILPEYETLLNMNQELIGWVKIDDTVIDYPVMQTDDNEYYLDHNFNGESDTNGCIFMDSQCDVVQGCDNIILYGHHMKSGKMFGALNKYSSQSYYEKHPTIQFDTIYEKGVYQIMYVFRSKVYSEEDVNFKYYQFIKASSETEFNSYMSEMASLSLYDTGVTASYGDKLLTLSTCDYQEKKGRFVVVAKKVS
jgi:sortase B